ncbi:hypothetical protein AAH991_03425 [Microbispora sp. ZYX-F-249]|uniref:SMI1/KNR4 family protein n=1 Tax=Microbispora maris TaxID=3144104 RepID=A0ABV0AHU1_9ACTN
MTGYLMELEALIGPPAKAAPPVDWPRVERDTGLTFPRDYRELTARYAQLTLGEYLIIDHPGVFPERSERRAAIDGLGSIRPDRTLEYVYLLDDEGETRVPPFPFFPEEGGLYPWGSTVDGQTLCWLTSADPDHWTIMVAEYGRYWHFRGSLLEFLVGILSQSIRCPLLSSNWTENRTVEESTRADVDAAHAISEARSRERRERKERLRRQGH